MCPSLGELTVSVRYLVYVTLCRRPSGMQEHGIRTRHYVLLSTTNTIVWSRRKPDYGKSLSEICKFGMVVDKIEENEMGWACGAYG